MKKIIYLSFLFQWLAVSPIISQVYNDGAEITIQSGAFIHVQGDFTNQGGIIFNDGDIEIGGNWFNNVDTNPLDPGSGTVHLLGDDQLIGGDFNTLFYDLNFGGDQDVLLESTIGIQNSININDGTIELNGNTLHILNSSNDAVQVTSGGVIAETADVYGFVRWDIGEMAEGRYVIPFQNRALADVPVSFEVTAQGLGDMGYLLFSTFATDEANNPFPLDVTNIEVSDDASGLALVDRFWVVEGVDFLRTPETSVTYSYDTDSEIDGQNNLDLAELTPINWDGDLQVWSPVENSTANDGSVTTSLTEQFGEFALWSDETSSVVDVNKLVDVSVYPNPSSDRISLEINSDRNEAMEVQIYNATGQLVSRYQENISASNNLLSYDISAYEKGTYRIVMIADSVNAIESFIKL